MNMKILLVSVAALLCLNASAVAWKNLDEASHYSGPKLTEADLAGKVVLVDCWGVRCPPCRALLPRMEELWKSFKNKPFVLVGSHCQGRKDEAVKKLVEENGLTYPIYERFGLAEGAPSFKAIPFLYVVNHRGRVVYSGHNEREATEAFVTAIGEIGAPPTLYRGVTLVKFKGMKKKLRLGQSIKNDVKKLQAAAAGKNAAMAEEAKAILEAIAKAKADTKDEIEAIKKYNPVDAVNLIKMFMVTWPEDGAEYKTELPELQKAAAEAKKAAGAKAAAAKK